MASDNPTPRFVPADYLTQFDAPCKYFPEYRMQGWYLGTGIAPAEHPLNRHISFGGCEHCNSNRALVIAAQYSVHPYSGDVYWDYELACPDCGEFTVRSYSEN